MSCHCCQQRSWKTNTDATSSEITSRSVCAESVCSNAASRSACIADETSEAFGKAVRKNSVSPCVFVSSSEHLCLSTKSESSLYHSLHCLSHQLGFKLNIFIKNNYLKLDSHVFWKYRSSKLQRNTFSFEMTVCDFFIQLSGTEICDAYNRGKITSKNIRVTIFLGTIFLVTQLFNYFFCSFWHSFM